jgi:hypothetical protein
VKPWRAFPVPIAHTTYRVCLFKKRTKVEGEEVQGYCDYGKREIGLWMNPNEEAMRACFWHEFAHGLLYELGSDSLADNHSLVEGMALAIMGVSCWFLYRRFRRSGWL